MKAFALSLLVLSQPVPPNLTPPVLPLSLTMREGPVVVGGLTLEALHGASYVAVPSLSGRWPGTPMPIGNFPLNLDTLSWGVLAGQWPEVFASTWGAQYVYAPDGKVRLGLQLPASPALIGLEVSCAAVVSDLYADWIVGPSILRVVP